jgi:hypothetical protein
MSSNFTEKSNEITQPVPVTNNYLFKLRLLFDLQLSTIYKLLIPHISKPPKTWSQSKNHSYLIDIGVGNDPWNKYIHPGFTKINLEVPALLKFNMNNILDTIIYGSLTGEFCCSESVLIIMYSFLCGGNDPML